MKKKKKVKKNKIVVSTTSDTQYGEIVSNRKVDVIGDVNCVD